MTKKRSARRLISRGAQRRRSLIGPQQPTIEAVVWPMKGTTATALEQGYLADELRGLCRANGVMVQGTKRERWPRDWRPNFQASEG